MPESTKDALITKLLDEKKIAREFQERRHEDWNENYELYRNKVRQNRLTQRQPVNIPLMKETVKTLLSKIDDPPIIDWEELSGDEMKEIILQEKWNTFYEDQNLEGIDIQDKKTAMLYGRPHKKLNWVNSKPTVTALDVFDLVVSPLTDPLNIQTAHYVIHQNIFRPLREILANPRYSAEGKKKLKNFLTSRPGIIQSGLTKEEFDKKADRLRAMGVDDQDFGMFGAGDAIVNLTEHMTHVWNAASQSFEKRVIVYADNEIELMNEPLKKLLGIDLWPFVTWSEDIETNDYWTDGPADLIRVPNKVANIYYSQWIENRTLRNFNMTWFAGGNNFTPQTYEPGQGRMLPAPPLQPGQSIRDVLMPVVTDALDDNINALEYITRVVERATAATAIEKGVAEKGTQTLGEVEILVGKAMERTVAMQKFYRRSWYELAMMWYQMVAANQTKKETLYKTDANGKVWPKSFYTSDWKSVAGYRPIVRSTSETESERTKGMQKLIYIQSLFPNNMPMRKIMQDRALEMIDVTPAELRQVQEAEKEAEKMNQVMAQQAQAEAMQQQPQENTLQQIQQKAEQLNSVNV